MPWYKLEKTSSQQEEQKLRLLSAIFGGFVAIGAIFAAAMDFAAGKGWVGARHLAMALLFIILAYKGPKWWSSIAVGVRVLIMGAILVYVALYIVQVIVPLNGNG